MLPVIGVLFHVPSYLEIAETTTGFPKHGTFIIIEVLFRLILANIFPIKLMEEKHSLFNIIPILSRDIYYKRIWIWLEWFITFTKLSAKFFANFRIYKDLMTIPYYYRKSGFLISDVIVDSWYMWYRAPKKLLSAKLQMSKVK